MSMCPTCNGMVSIHIPCPQCNTLMLDHGRISDYYAPYSPYREVDHIKMTEPALEATSSVSSCLHYISCPHCSVEGTVSIEEVEN
ncbi:hypothetical protein [Bacillus horti]|uniref:DNA-directed RNA polymerase subunit RPC12/RpoP n=1 Tax=Caldalkalibacillus horti TaxID=77523 RepID=A0ABT9W3X7_9BACI|nr:hypothetical protein [Bacillus horti]MDQ0167825.1 DNA-directed RNA polymerase subunit RPC12/RpoP [Bacillus horti]